MILVTGGAGYVGAVTVRALLEQGLAVRVLDRMMFGSRGIDAVRDKLDLVEGDIRRFDPAVFDGITAVIHLAGLSNDPMAEFNPQANHAINAEATRSLAQAAKQAGVRRFLYASSASLYDKGLDAGDELRDETSHVEPRAAYAVSKYEGEKAVLALKADDFVPAALRKGTVYGYSPRMRFDLVVNTFLKDALTKGVLTVFAGGEMWRPLVDVSDVARAYVALLQADEDLVSGQVFNLVFQNYRILELAHWVREALEPEHRVEVRVRREHSMVRSYRLSGRKLETTLGFKPLVSVKDSVTHMLGQIDEQGITDFMSLRYYNIDWLKLLAEAEATVKRVGPVF
jgi:nucleoside-diphosphate-sugar epimerase